MLDLAKMLHAQYDPTQPENVPEDPLAQLRADLAECKAQLKEAPGPVEAPRIVGPAADGAVSSEEPDPASAIDYVFKKRGMDR